MKNLLFKLALYLIKKTTSPGLNFHINNTITRYVSLKRMESEIKEIESITGISKFSTGSYPIINK